MTELINKERIDSIEIGTPSKGGALKVYFDASDLEKAKKLVDKALELRQYVNLKVNENG